MPESHNRILESDACPLTARNRRWIEACAAISSCEEHKQNIHTSVVRQARRPCACRQVTRLYSSSDLDGRSINGLFLPSGSHVREHEAWRDRDGWGVGSLGQGKPCLQQRYSTVAGNPPVFGLYYRVTAIFRLNHWLRRAAASAMPGRLVNRAWRAHRRNDEWLQIPCR
jgi:hypothetical protein